MEKIEYLPLGSIVYLKEGTKKLIVIARGLLVKNGDEFVYFDYGGVPYPEGLQGDKMAYFQHDAITKVIFKGFSDYDDEVTVEKINNFVEKNPEIKRGVVDELLNTKKINTDVM